jgi:hypothetical protein
MWHPIEPAAHASGQVPRVHLVIQEPIAWTELTVAVGIALAGFSTGACLMLLSWVKSAPASIMSAPIVTYGSRA